MEVVNHNCESVEKVPSLLMSHHNNDYDRLNVFNQEFSSIIDSIIRIENQQCKILY